MKTPNIKAAVVIINEQVFHLTNWQETKETHCLETGKKIRQGRREFNAWLKTMQEVTVISRYLTITKDNIWGTPEYEKKHKMA